jgi:hypothetical protein
MYQELNTLQKEYNRTPAEEVGDTYGDYRTGRKIIKVMYGKTTSKKGRMLQRRMRQKEEEIREALARMEEWLDEVEGSEIRDILRLYYAVGMTLDEIADRKGYDRSSIGKKIDRFWKKQEAQEG